MDFAQISVINRCLLGVLCLSTVIAVQFKYSTQLDKKTAEKLESKLNCVNKNLVQKNYQKGQFWALENHVRAGHKNNVKCHDSVTVTSSADYRFLDNLIEQVKRWRSPISLALYAPGIDYRRSMQTIVYLRECLVDPNDSAMIKELVTFHLYFESKYMPKKIYKSIYEVKLNCSVPISSKTFRKANRLYLPINVGRNLARDAALTYFVLPIDIELYPSDNLAAEFLKMIAKEKDTSVKLHRVFPLAIFEVKSKVKNPHNKTELQTLLSRGEAMRFHRNICRYCHAVPKSIQWEVAPLAPEMQIFTTEKRTAKFKSWEPIFIGTNLDPWYEERLSWEGKQDKMTQAFVMCVLQYEFALLNNGFLTHRPGIKSLNQAVRPTKEIKNELLIKHQITKELIALYGTRKECFVI